jgi:hypothetical protein
MLITRFPPPPSVAQAARPRVAMFAVDRRPSSCPNTSRRCASVSSLAKRTWKCECGKHTAAACVCVCVCVHAPIVLTGGTPSHSPFSAYVVLLAPLPLSRARPSCLPPFNALGLDKTIIGGLYVSATRVLLLCTVSAPCCTHHPSRCTSLATLCALTHGSLAHSPRARTHSG